MLVSNLSPYNFSAGLQVRNSFKGKGIIDNKDIVPKESYKSCEELDAETIKQIGQELSALRDKDKYGLGSVTRVQNVVRQVEFKNHKNPAFTEAIDKMIKEEKKIDSSLSDGLINKLEKVKKFNGRFDLRTPWANIKV